MSAEDVARVRQGFRDFMDGDFDALTELIEPDAQWLWYEPSEHECHGRDAILATLRARRDEGIVGGIGEAVDAGDSVFLAVTGPRMLDRFQTSVACLVVTLREGRIVFMRDFRGREEALHAVGVGPEPARGPTPSSTAPGADRVVELTAFVHVADPSRSVAFYERLGFRIESAHHAGERLDWAYMDAGAEARIMFARAEEAIDPDRQGVLFYLFSPNLTALRERLVAEGVEVGEIIDGRPGPRWEMNLTDPDGYVLTIAQIDQDTTSS